MPSWGITAARLACLGALCAAAVFVLATRAADREWLAGDSHIHSHWSAGYDHSTSPPTPIKARDAMYSTPRNAAMARQYGLRWMVTTDHGGPDHAKLNLEQAHRELTLSRELVPEVLQFYGMELNMPGMDHHTLIIPRAEDEAAVLYEIESRFDANEDWRRPPDPRRQSAELRREALAHMQGLERLPILFANHPSRSAPGIGVYGRDEPWELRENNDLAPDVYRGMEGAPGHQAATLNPGGRIGNRGAYGAFFNDGAPTLGGFDQMTAIVGGLWDALLGEGRRFWIVASSDSHFHYADPVRAGSDFWPGEFHKTWVHAQPTYAGVLDGLRQGRMFAVAARQRARLPPGERRREGGRARRHAAGRARRASHRGGRVPRPGNAQRGGREPAVRRVDVIVGEVVPPGRLRREAGGARRHAAGRARRAGHRGGPLPRPGDTERGRGERAGRLLVQNGVVAVRRVDVIVGEVVGRSTDPSLDRNPHAGHRRRAVRAAERSKSLRELYLRSRMAPRLSWRNRRLPVPEPAAIDSDPHVSRPADRIAASNAAAARLGGDRGTFLGQSLKSSEGRQDWLRFFELMGSGFALVEGGPLASNVPDDPDTLLQEARAAARRLQYASDCGRMAQP